MPTWNMTIIIPILAALIHIDHLRMVAYEDLRM